MERGVGQHDPQVGVARGDLGSELGAGPAGQEHDGRLRRVQELLGLRVEPAETPRRLQVGDHQGQGLLVTVLPLAQAPDCPGVAGVHQEVEPAQALDRHHLAPVHRGGGLGDGLCAGGEAHATGVPELAGRAAGRAGVGLGMEAAVGGIVVLTAAVGAHGEAGHGGRRPVVGHVEGDGEARAAVGAVGERVAVAAVGRVEDLRPAVGAGGQVRRDRNPPFAGRVAGDDREAAGLLWCDRLAVQLVDDGGRRRRGLQPCLEGFQGGRRPESLDDDAGRVVAHRAGHARLARQAIDPGAEADALDGAADLDPPAGRHHRHRPIAKPAKATSPLRTPPLCRPPGGVPPPGPGRMWRVVRPGRPRPTRHSECEPGSGAGCGRPLESLWRWSRRRTRWPCWREPARRPWTGLRPGGLLPDSTSCRWLSPAWWCW